MIDAAPDCFIALDHEGRVIEFNSAAEKTFGYTCPEAMGQVLASLIVPAASRETHPLTALLQAGQSHAHLLGRPTEMIAMRRDGTEFPVEMAICRLPGESLSFAACLRDISERKLLETQFLRAQRLESIGTLASGIAHDLNNILAPMMMAVNLLHENLRDSSSSRLLDTLRSSVQRGADMVKQIVSFTRGEDGVRSRVHLRQVIAEVTRIAGETFPRKVHLQIDLSKNLWPIQGDSTQLHQVLMNLCVNARDAMPDGGALCIQAENVQLEQGSPELPPQAAPGSYVALRVSDTGSGIHPDLLTRIWEPFFTTKPPGQGTGLGLPTVLTIVNAHLGFIQTSSTPRNGTTFRIFFPAADPAVPTTTIDKVLSAPEGHGEQILIIDDEQAIQEITKAIFEKYGYQALTASDGTEGLATFARNLGKIDLVLTDMIMPYLDGPATIAALRSVDPHVLILAISGMTENQQTVAETDQTRFLAKPFTTERLLTTVSQMLHPPTQAPLAP
jgi:PAS domain S-box-containing protein